MISPILNVFSHGFLNFRTARTLGSVGDKKRGHPFAALDRQVGEVFATKIPSLRLTYPLKVVGFQSESPFPGVYFSRTAWQCAKTQVAPENGWLEDHLPFGKAYFQRRFG